MTLALIKINKIPRLFVISKSTSGDGQVYLLSQTSAKGWTKFNFRNFCTWTVVEQILSHIFRCTQKCWGYTINCEKISYCNIGLTLSYISSWVRTYWSATLGQLFTFEKGSISIWAGGQCLTCQYNTAINTLNHGFLFQHHPPIRKIVTAPPNRKLSQGAQISKIDKTRVSGRDWGANSWQPE